MSTRLQSLAVLSSLVLAFTASADKNVDHDQGKPGTSGKVSFQISIPPDALDLETSPIEGSDSARIARVSLDLDEPVLHHDAPGEPILPMIRRLVAIPQHATPVDVQINRGSPVVIDDIAVVAWGQIPRPGQQSSKRVPIPPPPTIIDQQLVFYSGADAIDPVTDFLKRPTWPEQQIDWRLSNLGGKAAPIVQLEIHPVVWNPQQQQLLFYPDQEIIVHYELPKSQPHIKAVFADLMTVESLKTLVVNPGLLPPINIPTLQKIDAPYLIITDDYAWSEDGVRGDSIGNAIAQMRRIAEWKMKKGIRSKVVTVSEIVSGRYGDFSRDSADLQETIRNFLKHAREKWNTYYVLLGGSDVIIPPRMVMASANTNSRHALLLKDDPKPSLGRSYWDAATRTIRVHVGHVSSDETLYEMRDGTAYEYVGWPTVRDPGWGYATSDTYASPSLVETEYLVIRGVPSDHPSHIHLAEDENVMPTDLYYASVDDPLYDVPGQKDWDASGNGIYGQLGAGGSIDGVSFEPDLAVGRAPFDTAEQAEQWVDRTLAYEQYDLIPGLGRQLLLVGDNWGSTGPSAEYTSTFFDLEPGKAHVLGGSPFREANINFLGRLSSIEAIFNSDDWFLVYSSSAGSFTLGYNRDASETSGGYYFTTDETFSTLSETTLEIFGLTFRFRKPTRFVRAFGPFDVDHSVRFFGDNFEPDGVIEHKEKVANALARTAPRITHARRLYADWYDYPGDPAAVEPLTEPRAELAFGGNNIVSIAGHGLPAGCCGLAWYSSFSHPYDSGLVYADSCFTARYRELDPSLAQRVTTGWGLGGAAAYVGNSGLSWIGLGNDLEVAFWDRFGRSTTLAELHHTKAQFQRWDTELWSNYSLTLFGDPELQIWRGIPHALNVEAPASITPGTAMRVRVTNEAGVPLEFVRVVMTGSNVFEIALTDHDGWAELPPVTSPGTVTVVVAPSGYLPFEREIEVRPGG